MAGTKDVFAKLVDRDYAKVASTIEKFILDYVQSSSSTGVVIGLSGGLDSSVLVKMCVNSLGARRVFGLILPSRTTPKEDVDDAVALADSLDVKYEAIDINPILDSYMKVLPDDKKAKGNLMARVRMSIIYHHAFVRNAIVAGTSDKSELYIGYFTKYGDGGADIIPIADLYKTQVRALGRHLAVPSLILEKKSSPRLWENHIAEDEIGLDYEVVDPILHMLIDRKLAPILAAKELEMPVESVTKVQKMIEKSAHKRTMAKMPQIQF
jgi:NAD+ synthase